ncbi:UNVERIFIED_CONTAM: hypothetical protein FKN15_066904 [Acipenser sinensis]
MSGCRTDCLEKPLGAAFKKLGRFVGRYPLVFVVISLLASCGLGSGFYYLKQLEANDIEDQFTPWNGPAKEERVFIKNHFPISDSNEFSSQRLYTEGAYSSLAVVSKTGNILTDEAFKEILELDRIVKGIRVSDGDQNHTYSSLCAKENNNCVSNAILDIINSGQTSNLTYPVYKNNVFLGSTVGGVKTDDTTGIVKSAKAIRLYYYLRENETESNTKWLNEFVKYFSGHLAELHLHSVSYFTSVSRQNEFEGNSKKVIPLFSITYFVVIFFSIVSCLRFDCVRNKAWVATFGVLSAGLAVLSAFGMLLYCGMPFAMTVANAPFLILGIGVDDMFIMISCWQKTKVHDSVADRLAETYKEAAVSITITTLTDVLAFYIGIMTPFRSVQSFCLYTGTAVLFCYLYNITFFGAFLALNGKREKGNRHWLTCMKVEQDCPAGRSTGYSMCCVGGAYDANTDCEKEQPVNLFFKKYYGPFLTNTWTKVFVVLLYGGYLASSIYGCLQMQEGIDLRNLAYDGSYVVNYYDDEDAYFSEYGPRVMVVVTEQVDYWNKEVRKEIESCLKVLENRLYVDASLSVSWLRVYENVSKLLNINLDNETGAVSTILGVIVLAAAESYIFRTFFKIMFLVISFGALHGIVFIPVFLTFFGVSKCYDKDKEKQKEMTLLGPPTATKQVNVFGNSHLDDTD